MSISHEANMTLFEDETLCQAYIEISVDSINDANQIVGSLAVGIDCSKIP